MASVWEKSRHRYLKAALFIANIYYHKKDYSNAKLYYQECAKLNRLAFNIYFPLGCSHMELKEFKEAEAAFVRSDNNEFGSRKSSFNLAYIYMQQKK